MVTRSKNEQNMIDANATAAGASGYFANDGEPGIQWFDYRGYRFKATMHPILEIRKLDDDGDEGDAVSSEILDPDGSTESVLGWILHGGMDDWDKEIDKWDKEY